MSDGVFLTGDLLLHVLQQQLKLPLEDGPFVLGLRGAVKEGTTHAVAAVDHVRMRCRVMAVTKNGVRGRILLDLPGTTAPGRHWLLHPMNRQGTAMLAPGLQRAHRRGLHKGKPAFRQMQPLWVLRDSNRSGGYESGDALVQAGADCAINIHYGGTASALIGRWSAGCVVVARGWQDAGYRGLLGLFDPAQTVPLVIVPFALLLRAVNENGFVALSLGSRDKLVSQVQQRLGLAQDGVFGPQTLKAVMAFQKQHAIAQDGVCGPTTLKKLQVI